MRRTAAVSPPPAGLPKGPAGRARLAELSAAERAAVRREARERLHRGARWLASLVLLAVLVGMMIGRLVDQRPLPAAPPRVVEVRVQHDGQPWELQLLLDRPLAYQRREESGAVSLQLPGVTLEGGPRRGRLRHAGGALAWRVEARDGGVQVLLVALAGDLQVRDRLEPAGAGYRLRLEVARAATPARPAP